MKRALLLSFLTVAAALAQAETTADQQVILDSNVSRYVRGALVAADMVFTLDQGQFVVVASANGTLVRVDGPHNGLAKGEQPRPVDLRAALVQLVGGESQGLGGLGGARGTDDDAPGAAGVADLRSSPWLIHAELTGEQCYVEERQSELWRNDENDRAEFELREVSTDRAAAIRWRNGEHVADWPADLPPRDGEIYLIRDTGKLRSGTTIRVFSLDPGAADDPYAAAAWLAARGCMGQARLALAALD